MSECKINKECNCSKCMDKMVPVPKWVLNTVVYGVMAIATTGLLIWFGTMLYGAGCG